MDSGPEPGRLFLLLKAGQAAMRAALCDALDDIGITPPQLLALRAIYHTPAISNAEMARQCFVSPQAMVVTLSRMEQMGLIERVKGEGRVIETHLTKKGTATLDRAAERIAAAERYLCDALGEERVDALCATLGELNDALLKSQVVTTSRSWDLDE
jgi:DNA-binding MarR family transcriptional regulator